MLTSLCTESLAREVWLIYDLKHGNPTSGK